MNSNRVLVKPADGLLERFIRAFSPAYVQQQLGHASIKMTVDTFTHLIPGVNRDATNVLPGLSGVVVKKAEKR